ncbi:adenylate kinase family protein [Bremerella sp. P1]|uniref:adenylate kinase family protein n=1 Tax=Bremerella sp. P1 TaxID=3026424 RepID=UPI0023678591|nr:nucleoside monophosphate kinase [Bremerella sp. P1]WDI45125.1 nucleoside monophosphate kinase [Bremerella sp. P1]
MHKYVFMGVQGSGKGTQAKLLEQHLDLTHIGVGDILRWNIKNHTKLAAKIKRILNAGKLVDDEIVEEIVQRRLQEHDWNFGFILDGFPRNANQAAFFLESYDIDAVVHIVVPDDVIKKRVLARRLCEDCGVDFNVIDHRPKIEGRCDICGGKLIRRADDTEEVLANRLAEYHEKTKPVLEIFRRKELVVEVDGTQAVDIVQAEIRKSINII